MLDCSGTKISDLTPIKDLANLNMLYCSRAQVSDLTPIKDLSNLNELYCSDTEISDLTPIKDLANLNMLYFSDTEISDLTPIKDLANLNRLDCSGTKISDLTPIKDLANLNRLDCSGTKISDLTPIKDLSNLNTLYLHNVIVPGIPKEALSQTSVDNCLVSLKSYLKDLEGGHSQHQEAKLMILGNGRVGKTQIARSLTGLAFEENADSTHGITVSTTSVPGLDTAQFHLWDFGGQDIYHGTHALFMRSRAVFLLAWSPEMEDTPTHKHGGMTFRNYPLLYWINYIKQFAGSESSVIIVQTHCDEPGMEKSIPNEVNEELDQFTYCKTLQFSALNKRGKSYLDEVLREAYERIEQPLIGQGRLSVIEKINDMMNEDAKKPVDERLYRTLSHQSFIDLCNNTGHISYPEQFLVYLHRCGFIFYQLGYFNNQIILDQSWALDAVYSVFHRESSYLGIENGGGQFTEQMLGAWLWNDLGYSESEQSLFIEMMLSCHICFRIDKYHYQYPNNKRVKTRYIAPDLLPDSPPSDLYDHWDTDSDTLITSVFRYVFLPSTLLRNFMSDIGNEAQLGGRYWKTGFYVSEKTTKSKALIEQINIEQWSGEIRIQLQGLQAMYLLDTLIEKLVRVEQNIGIAAQQRDIPSIIEALDSNEIEPLEFQTQEKAVMKYYVSYAWGDDKSEAGKRREDKVNQLCEEAESRGIHIHRDKSDLKFGDSISQFMKQLAQGDRIFMFLSDKYLKSDACMTELHGIWVKAGNNDQEFIDTVRVFILEDADIWDVDNRIDYSGFWKDRFSTTQKKVDKYGSDILSPKDHEQFRLRKKFSDSMGEVLSVVVDRLHPRKWEDFIDYGFD